jgi:hypothetical protein
MEIQRQLLLMIISQLMQMEIGALLRVVLREMNSGLWFLKKLMPRCMEITTILKQEKFNMLLVI